MSGFSGDSGVPSGFFVVQNTQQANRSNRASRSPGGGPPQNTTYPQRRGYQHLNDGQPTTFCPYGAVHQPQQQHQNHQSRANHSSYASANVQVPRKRPRCEVFRCEPCNLELDSHAALQSHKQSHVKCSSCDFEGAPKVVKGHFQSVHGKFSGSGFKTVTVAIPGCPVQRFRICVGNRPEDVQKWIEERKKRFPRCRPPAPVPKTEPKTEQGLSALLDGYSSSEDEKDSNEKDNQGSQSSPKIAPEPAPAADSVHSIQNKNPCHSFVRHGRCRRGDACPYSHDESLRKPTAGKRKEAPQKKKRDLLSNLLESDGDRETKLSLQIIHYLVHSDFLKARI